MTASAAFEHIVLCAMFHGGSHHPDGALGYVRSGREIPERLLPGRYLTLLLKARPDVREALSGLTSSHACNVRDDVIRWQLETR